MSPLLDVQDVSIQITAPDGTTVHPVQNVNLALAPGEIVGLVGESGSGKTLTALSILGLLPRGSEVSGSIRLAGDELLGRSEDELRRIRGKDISMVFQDPMSSLNPALTIGRQITDILHAHQKISRTDALAKAVSLLAEVGLPEPERARGFYPHELSGGMCQRAMISMALACGPQLLIADEPTTALDVTIQAQIIDLLRDLAEQNGLTVLLVSHDLAVIAEVCDRIVTMYHGQIVSIADRDELLSRPPHPYTERLLATARISFDAYDQETMANAEVAPIRAEIPEHGCNYAPRCEYALDKCWVEPAQVVPTASGLTRCHRPELVLAGVVDL